MTRTVINLLTALILFFCADMACAQRTDTATTGRKVYTVRTSHHARSGRIRHASPSDTVRARYSVRTSRDRLISPLDTTTYAPGTPSWHTYRAGRALQVSSRLKFASIGFAVGGGICVLMAATNDDMSTELYAASGAFLAGFLACELASIYLQDKAGRELRLSVLPGGASFSLTF